MTTLVRRLLAGIGAALSALLSGGVTASPATEGQVTIRHFDDVLDGRAVRIYLPPGYAESSDRYPVVYMFDGQNLFDEETSFAGEWGVDEACDREIAAGHLRPLLVVGIDNGGYDRLREYTPWPDGDDPDGGPDSGPGPPSDPSAPGGPSSAGGGGREHLRAIIQELKPRIDAEYRTLPAADHTGIAGSSLGGLMALFAALEAPRTFTRIGALSPSLGWADGRLTREFEAGRPRQTRLYVDMGTREARRLVDQDRNRVDDHIDHLRAFESVARRRLIEPDDNLRVVEDEGGVHHESAWARRIGAALTFLFPNSV